MDDFLYIKTFFHGENERTINNLSSVYKRKDLLKSILTDLINPVLLSDNIINGKSVLLKPNWVNHPLNKEDDICLITNEDFILTVLEIISEKRPRSITIADAPIQSCNWSKLLKPDFIANMNSICKEYKVSFEIKDLRKVYFDPVRNKKIKLNSDLNYTYFDLGKDSQLEPVSLVDKNPFRVTYYNPERFRESHFPGTHKYCISNDFLDSDIVISLPKIKTHQKTGITCALKNLVGINGDKDFLPHHRIGGSRRGGDCYPGKNIIRYFSELTRDIANRNIGNINYKLWAGISYLLWNSTPSKGDYSLSAGWYGNDTTWRMVSDINTIALFGTRDGKISREQQRNIFSICDGIIGGQGEGPLRPAALPLGIVTFTNNSAINDAAIATLMNFDYLKFPMLANSISHKVIDDFKILLNNKETGLESLKNIAINVIPPNGWKEYLSENL